MNVYLSLGRRANGLSLIDASMRCLTQTGWLNFRMRAMLATFATFPLWLPWKSVAIILPGFFLTTIQVSISAQFQMQAEPLAIIPSASTTLTNKLRIMIRKGSSSGKWVPELKNVPLHSCFNPGNDNHGSSFLPNHNR